MKEIELGDIAFTRSGDKGPNANVGVIFKDKQAYKWAFDNLNSSDVKLYLGSLVKGDVVRFDENNSGKNIYKIPQIGWNSLIETKNSSVSKSKKNILRGLSKSPSMYFLHSYFVKPKNENIAIAETHYGKNTFCSAFKKENVIGFQFHPERSGKDGLLLLKNFVEI